MLRVAPHMQVGTVGPVTATFRQAPNGITEVQIAVDYAKAAQPEFSYVADHCSVSPGDSGYIIAFGKMTSDRSALRTRVEISFPESMFQKQLINSTRDFKGRMPIGVPIRAIPQRDFPDPEKIQTFRSNNAMIGAWGDEGVVDFFFLSPSDFGGPVRTGPVDIRLTPVVRVTLSIGLLNDFLTKCHSFDGHSLGSELEE
jgi:hypothetical protein